MNHHLVMLKGMKQLPHTSPHQSTDITSYTQCNFSLIGVYGAEVVYLTTNYSATTPLAGRYYSYSFIALLFTQLLLYQSVISHSHQWSQCQ